MIWTANTKSTSDYVISYPVFEGENKKEMKWANRMNRFYSDIIEAAIKSVSEKDSKCALTVIAEKTDVGISVSLSYRARRLGRTIKSYTCDALWEKGYIRKKHA